ncbi:MAG: dihydroneopterin aldolase [Bradyrhizobium sp.]|nr:dihydroneopterin aldolase [Bradyrhizobium sp.]
MTQPYEADGETFSRCRVGVESYRVQALIGIHAHELNQRQQLVVTAMLEVRLPEDDALGHTVDYGVVTATIDRIAGAHIKIIERFAAEVARACLADPLVVGVRVRVEKPSALPGGLACTEVEVRRPAIS